MSYDPTKPFTHSGELRPLTITIGGGTHRDRIALLHATTTGLHDVMGSGLSVGYAMAVYDTLINVDPFVALPDSGRYKMDHPVTSVRVSYDDDHLCQLETDLNAIKDPRVAMANRGITEDHKPEGAFMVKVGIFGETLWVSPRGLVGSPEFATRYENLTHSVITEHAAMRDLVHEYNFANHLRSEYSHFDYEDRIAENRLATATVEIWRDVGESTATKISEQTFTF